MNVATPRLLSSLVLLTGLVLAPSALAGGTVVGKVTFSGPAPTPDDLNVDKDLEVCGTSVKKDPSMVVGNGGELANVVVSVEGAVAPEGSGDDVTVTLDQKECEYGPHVQAARKGGKIILANSDPVLHNVHAYLGETKTIFNSALPKAGQTTTQSLRRAGVVHIKCDAHKWMEAWVVVKDHPWYAVTSADGSFRIEDVPAGKYELELWHEELGTTTVAVTVTDGSEARVDVTW